jgi:glyoxylase-like metal-dependent hydrolase (beta-lactamase superfamily II)
MKIAADLPLYRITLPTPFPVGPVNLYIITEPELVMIDAGPMTAEARESLHRQLHEHALDASRIKRIILTHSHQDHYGLAAELSRLSGAPVYAHPVEHASIRHDPEVAAFHRGLIGESGSPPRLRANMARLFHYLTGVSEAAECRSTADLGTVQCGPAILTFVTLPGHTPGSVGLWNEERGLLIGGDTAIERITPNPFSAPDPGRPRGRFRSLGEYWTTFNRIREMRPGVIHAGHGEPIREFDPYYEWSLKLHRSRQELIVKSLRERECTVHEVAEYLFPEVMREGSFLALTEVFSHLDLLEEEGRVRAAMKDGVSIYSL